MRFGDQRMMLLSPGDQTTTEVGHSGISSSLPLHLRGQSDFLPNAGSPGWKDGEISREFRGILVLRAS